MDSSSFLECEVCRDPYNQTTKIPLSLACGHTFCKSCIQNIQTVNFYTSQLKCPTCRKISHTSSTNYALLAQLNVKIMPKCKKHIKDLEMICKECKISICSKCSRDDHKDHDSLFWDDLNTDINKKFDENDELIRQLNEKKSLFNRTKKHYHDQIHSLIERKFNMIIKELKQNEESILKQIEDELETIQFDQFENQDYRNLDSLTSLKSKYSNDKPSVHEALEIIKFQIDPKLKKDIENIDFEDTLKERLDAIKILWPPYKFEEVKVVNDPQLKLKKSHKDIQSKMIDQYFADYEYGVTDLTGEMISLAMNAFRFTEIDYKNFQDPILKNPQYYYDMIFSNSLNSENSLVPHINEFYKKVCNHLVSTKVVTFLGSNSKYSLFPDFLSDELDIQTQRIAVKFKQSYTILDFNSFDQAYTQPDTFPIEVSKMNNVVEQIAIEFSNAIICVIEPDSIKDLEMVNRLKETLSEKKSASTQLIIVHKENLNTADDFINSRVKLERKFPKLEGGYELDEEGDWLGFYTLEDDPISEFHFLAGVSASSLDVKYKNFANMMIKNYLGNSTYRNALQLQDKIQSELDKNLKVKKNPPQIKANPSEFGDQSLILEQSFSMANQISSFPTLGYRLYTKSNNLALVMEIEMLGNTKFDTIIPSINKQGGSFTIRVSLSRWFKDFDKKKYLQDSRKKEIYEVETLPLEYEHFKNLDFGLVNQPYYDQGWVVISWGKNVATVIDLL